MPIRWLQRCVDANSMVAARGRRWQPIATDSTKAAADNAAMSVGGDIVAVVVGNLQCSLLMVRINWWLRWGLSFVQST